MIPISAPTIGDDERQAVIEVLDSGMLAQGPKVAELEEKFAKSCETTYAVATSSGTTALHLALLSHGIGEGKEVITSPFTFIASINSILFVGAKPVFVDIEEDTFNIDPRQIEAAITPNTAAIMPVHLFGYPCNMEAIMEIAERHNLLVIEDAAQAIGATFKGKRTGSFGTGCFSLYATKNVMSGEGGMITTNDEHIADRVRMMRNHGMRNRYHYEMLGFNFRMSDIHAAIGCVQIGKLDIVTAKRQANAMYLNSHLTAVTTPTVRKNYEHVWHQYTVRIPDDGTGQGRDKMVEELRKKGVGAAVFYPVPAHKHPYLKKYDVEVGSLPIAERSARQVFSLPVHPKLQQPDLEKIVYEVNQL